MKECDDDIFAEPEVGKWEADYRNEVLSGDSGQEDILQLPHSAEHWVDEEDCFADPQDLAGVEVQVNRTKLLMLCLVVRFIAIYWYLLGKTNSFIT